MTRKTASTSNDRSQRQKEETTSPTTSQSPNNGLLPSYETLYPANIAPSRPRPPLVTRSTRETENINTLRDGNPRLALDPPLPKRTRIGSADAAARTATIGVSRACRESDPVIAAAHTAKAIAVAVSTSRSYADFVAATTAAESAALLIAEAHRDNIPSARHRQRVRNAINSAVESATAADTGTMATGSWPSNTHKSQPPSHPPNA